MALSSRVESVNFPVLNLKCNPSSSSSGYSGEGIHVKFRYSYQRTCAINLGRNPLRSPVNSRDGLAYVDKSYCYPCSVSIRYSRSTSNALLVKKNQCRNILEEVGMKGVSEAEERKPMAEIRRKKLAVFVSGGGSNFRSIYEATVSGAVHGDVVVLVTNKNDCGGAEFARSKGIPIIVFPRKRGEQELFSSEHLVGTLRSYDVDFILLAGYLKLIPVELVKYYPKSIVNIHPSLLPAFGGKGYYGMKVHQAVIASGARFSGATIHYVDEEYDTGRIIAQRVVPVLAKDTPQDLAARVLHEEHELYVEVAAALCEERILWREDGVPLIRSKEDPNYLR